LLHRGQLRRLVMQPIRQLLRLGANRLKIILRSERDMAVQTP
jgi:hypothetical protein